LSPIALFLLQANRPELPDFLKQIGITSVEILGVVVIVSIVVGLIVIRLLQLLTMWWFGVTQIIDRLDRVIGRLDAVEKALKKEEF
jgi:hypothetical protein